MITLEEGLIMTCLFPLFSALYMLLRASFNTLILTILSLLNKRNQIIESQEQFITSSVEYTLNQLLVHSEKIQQSLGSPKDNNFFSCYFIVLLPNSSLI